MNALVRILMLAPFLLGGCRATHDVAAASYHVTRGAAVGSYKVARAVAVGSYRVASAPVHYATRKRGDKPSTIVGTETPSDVTNPGQSIPPPETVSASQQQPRVEAERNQSGTSGATSRMTRREAAQSSTSVSSSRASAPTPSFPTGKPVPGKPGYVFSPFTSERYVDVSGFAPGTKVKDPWTDKIFIVP